MKEPKKVKEVKQPEVHTNSDPNPPTCPEGYVWDDVLEKCVLDTGK